MKRTNTTSTTPPRAKRSMPSALDLDQNTVALEEQERLRTLVFIGLPESHASLPSERVQEDRKVATKILDHLEVEAEPIAVFRLGRHDPQRTTPRPLKVVMPTPTHQHMALGGWKRERARLRSQQNLTRLFVRPALTKEQLKKEYEERTRKRQQTPAAPLVTTKDQSPVAEKGPNQKKVNEDISELPDVFEQTILVCYEALNSLPPIDKISHQSQSLEKQFPRLFNK
ncbi:hypothetical protein niasHT_020104 [Heterodera trifolii]|uniref:Uncharacterized protein n=1 Tax=Heterodera trifolii TaxID=157864 RepID=A0ABD2LJM7_9BILA